MIIKCVCSGLNGNNAAALQQDAMYGQGNRVHNPMVKENMFRCTICGAEKNGPSKKSKKEDAADAAKAKEEQGKSKRK